MVPNAPDSDVPAPRGKGILVAFLALAMIGLGVSAYLTEIHYQTHTDPAYHSVCAVSETVNCETVAESKYSVFLGLPVSCWGLLAYAAIAILSAWGLAPRRRHPTWPRGALFALSTLAFAGSASLAYLSFFRIDSLCIFCVSTYAINTALFALAIALAIRSRLGPLGLIVQDLRSAAARPLAVIVIALAFGGAIAAGELLVPPYWVHLGWKDLPALPTGVDESGHHWTGAKSPTVIVTEFSDYQCPHCRRAHRNIRQMAAKYAGSVRLVHRHQPLDQACNPHVSRKFHDRACELSAAAACAGDQEKFWEMNDALFSLQDEMPASAIDLTRVAVEIGLDRSMFQECLDGREAMPRIRADIAEAEERGVTGTPTFFIGNQPFPGGFPESILRSHVEAAAKP